MKNKKNSRLTTIILVVVAVVITATITILLTTNNVKFSDFWPFSNKTEIAAKKLGDKFYQDFYYAMITRGKKPDEIAATLAGQEYKIALDQIEKINEINVQDIIDGLGKEKDKYNWQETKVIIKPKAPFGKTDYDISVELVKK